MANESDKTEVGGVATPDDSAAINPLAADPELLNDFILESREHLTSIELQLLTLDQDPGNAEAIHAIFRGFHTIKGMAGFLDQDAIRDVAHEFSI
jgi:two-component system chemotaxis sensor kinase CheA